MLNRFYSLMTKEDKPEQKAVVVQRATSYYQPYAVEYHPFIVNYRSASLVDHCQFLTQQKVLYAFLETRIEQVIQQGDLFAWPDDLRKDSLTISEGMERDLRFFKEFLPHDLHIKNHYICKNYLKYLSGVDCECELLGNYLALLGLNYYGGKYAFIPALKVISQQKGLDKLAEKMQFSSTKMIPEFGASAFPLVDRPQGFPRMNDLIKQWIVTTATAEQIKKEYMPKIFVGYYRAIFYLKLLCDAMLARSLTTELKSKPDTNKKERETARESAMLVALEHQCTYGKYRDVFKKKGLSVCAYDDEKYAWKALGCSDKEPEAITREEMLNKGRLLLSVTPKKHKLQAEWISQGQKFHLELGKLIPKEFKRIEEELDYIDSVAAVLASSVPSPK